ncbi:dipeptide ABC transporter ATP-binding protein [beta proteobacterium MWH-UniP1]
MTPILSVSHLRVCFQNGSDARHQHSHMAVDDVSFDIYPGDRLAIVGESGSGKTVTALSILRLLPDAHTTGRIQWSPPDTAGQTGSEQDLITASEREIRAIRGRDIAMVFQEPMSALNPLLTVGQQIAEVLELHEGLSTKAALQKAVELLDRTGVDEPQRRAHSYPHQLSGGQRQRVVIAMALACSPKLLIADEPTTALDVTIREQVLELLLKLQHEEGMAILLITHDLPLVQRFANRVGVMQLGKLVEQGPTDTIFTSPQHDYTKRLLASRPRRMVGDSVSRDVILSARGVNATFEIPVGWFGKRRFMAVANEALTLSKGETLGIVGESGSGKTTFGMALLQLSGAQVKGEVQFDGQSLYQLPKQSLRKLRRRMQIVFQDPFSALSPRMTIGQILGEGLQLHFPELSREERETKIAEMLEEVGLPANSVGRYPHEFSGGQRQRIAIARAVILQPDLVLLDEPTSALDVSIQQQVLELLVRLQQKHGMAYLFITHDLAVIKAIAHRVMVMRAGKVVESGYTEEVLSKPREEYTWRLVTSSAV